MNRIITYIRESLESFYSFDEVKAISVMIYTDVLGLDSINLYTGKDIKLSDSMEAQLENILSRLKKYEPIQYILGYTDFAGRRFKVNENVLIPRPETYELIELVAKESSTLPRRILDIGTGSGCIAISLDLMLKNAQVTAWDVSPEALLVAKENNERLKANVFFAQQDVLAPITTEEKYDVIVSNPPYIGESESDSMDSNVTHWEPRLALFVPDDDCLLFYRRIADIGRKLLNNGGTLYFEINQLYGNEVVDLLSQFGYSEVSLLKDIYQNNRIVKAIKK